MQGCLGINMLVWVDWIRRPASTDGVFNFLARVVVAAVKFQPIYYFDRMQNFPDVIPQLCEVSQEC
jgi:hypothetical protein